MSSYKINMTRGPILSRMTVFILPLCLTYTLQSLFNAADMAIIGRFSSHESLAAIGATSVLSTLFLKVLIGLSTGANAVIATCCGEKDPRRIHQSVHTAMALSIYSGLFMTAIALLFTKPLLILMNTPEQLLPRSCTYLHWYFAGITFMTIFNFGCSVLRSMGDSKRPLYILTAAGILNVLLNLLFVVGFRMDVAGVAAATTAANFFAAAMIVRILVLSGGSEHLNFRKLKISWGMLKGIFWIGIPAGINSSFYNISNMVIQSAINQFDALAIAGIAAATSIESFVSVTSSAFQQTTMTFVAQNYGAENHRRVIRCCITGVSYSMLVSFVLGWGLFLAGPWLMRLFTADPEVVRFGMIKMQILMTTLFIGGMMDSLCGCLRGIGSSILPTVSSLCGACLFRIGWIFAVFPHFKTLEALYLCFPASWVIVSAIDAAALAIILRCRHRSSAD